MQKVMHVTFTVSGTELAITSAGVLTFVSAPDYETKATYTATVTASDGVNSNTQNITVNITNDEDDDPIGGIILPQSVQLVETQSEES